MTERSVGASLRHDSAEAHVAGRAVYIDDIAEPPGLLHLAFGLAADGHARLMGLEPQSWLPVLGRRLKALHIQENDGKGDDHMLPFVNGGDGVKWVGFAEALAHSGYQGAFTYEVHNAFNAVPDAFFDTALRYAAEIAKFIITPADGAAVGGAVADARAGRHL